MAKDDFIDFYALLGVDHGADDKAIQKAYRRKALELHPDKNPDNPKAEELFMQIKVASDALLDPVRRGELDAKISARAAVQARYASMDSKRAKLRSDLEEREKAAADASRAHAKAATSLAADIDRLRKDGQARQQQYNDQLESLRRAAREEAAARAAADLHSASTATSAGTDAADGHGLDMRTAVRVKWSAAVGAQMATERMPRAGSSSSSSSSSAAPHEDFTIPESRLRSLFKLYGAISTVFARKARSACIVFASVDGAERAVAVQPSGFTVTHVLGNSAGAAASSADASAPAAASSAASSSSSAAGAGASSGGSSSGGISDTGNSTGAPPKRQRMAAPPVEDIDDDGEGLGLDPRRQQHQQQQQQQHGGGGSGPGLGGGGSATAAPATSSTMRAAGAGMAATKHFAEFLSDDDEEEAVDSGRAANAARSAPINVHVGLQPPPLRRPTESFASSAPPIQQQQRPPTFAAATAASTAAAAANAKVSFASKEAETIARMKEMSARRKAAAAAAASVGAT